MLMRGRVLAVILTVTMLLTIGLMMLAPASAEAFPGKNGKIAFFMSSDFGFSYQIFVVNPDGTGLQQLTPTSATVSYVHPTWSPDGTKIAFCCDQDKEQNGWNGDIYVMNADGSNVQQITNTPEEEWGLDWTAFSYSVEPAGKLKSTWGKIKQALFSP